MTSTDSKSSSPGGLTPKITIIVLNWNGKEDTLRCLASLKSVSLDHKVIVVDNGSTDDSIAVISQAHPEVELIATGQNLGYAEGNNVGIRHALLHSPDYLLILNNDTTVDSEILRAFCQRDLPIQGGLILQMHDPSRIDQLGGQWNLQTGKFDAVALNAPADEWTKPMQLDFVSGSAMFIRADLFREIGLFDARFFLFWEECDWCARAARQGYAATFCPEAKVYHRGSASFVGGAPQTMYYWTRNRMLWIELNCNAADQQRLLLQCRRESQRTKRRYWQKRIQSFVTRATPARRTRLMIYRAEIQATKDYDRRQFGKAPDWLCKRQPESATQGKRDK